MLAAGAEGTVLPSGHPPPRLAQAGTLLLLFLGYGSSMMCRGNLDVTIPALTRDTSSGVRREDIGLLLALGTASYCAGKCVNGVMADKFGGARIFVVVFAVSACTTALIGVVVSSFGSFAGLWMVNRFVQAGGWPAMTQVVRGWFEPETWGKVWGVLSMASRFGAFSTNMILGTCLQNGLGWRTIFIISGAVLGTDVLINIVWLKPGPNQDTQSQKSERQEHAFDGLGASEVLRIVATNPRMCSIAASIGCLCVLTEVGSFVPLFLVDRLHLPSGEAAQYASAFTGGMAVGVLAGGCIFDTMSHQQKRVFVVVCALVATMSWGVLAHTVTHHNPNLHIVLTALFIAGAAVSVPYYLPSAVFSIEFGGSYAGTVSSVIDATGYGCTIIFQATSGSMISNHGWAGFLFIVFLLGAFGTIGLIVFEWLEFKHLSLVSTEQRSHMSLEEQVDLEQTKPIINSTDEYYTTKS